MTRVVLQKKEVRHVSSEFFTCVLNKPLYVIGGFLFFS